MGPIWGRQDPGGPHVGPMNFAIWVYCTLNRINFNDIVVTCQSSMTSLLMLCLLMIFTGIVVPFLLHKCITVRCFSVYFGTVVMSCGWSVWETRSIIHYHTTTWYNTVVYLLPKQLRYSRLALSDPLEIPPTCTKPLVLLLRLLVLLDTLLLECSWG